MFIKIPGEIVSGQFCECDNFNCPRHDRMLCGGHGEVCYCNLQHLFQNLNNFSVFVVNVNAKRGIASVLLDIIQKSLINAYVLVTLVQLVNVPFLKV